MEILEIEKYIRKRLVNELNPCYNYHDLNHTLDVANSAEIIAKHEGISERNITILKTAALLHDVGIISQFKEHEKHSVAIAKEILPQYGYNKEDIDIIAALIHATVMPQQPKNLMEEIICDADLDYLGRDDYFEISSRLRKEWFCLYKMDFFDIQWYISQKEFLSNHNYHTSFSQKIRNEKKIENIIKIQSFIDRSKQ